MQYNNLFSPLRVNGIVLRNRIIAAPMGLSPNYKIPSSTNYGAISAFDRSLSGAAMVHLLEEGIEIFSKYELDKTREDLNIAKQDGAKVSCEVGFFSMKPDKDGYVYGPMDGIRFDGLKMKAFTKETMKEFYDLMASTCKECKRFGFDAVTLHVGHDSLGSQFLSPVWNQRTDEYGGSIENRGRFMREALIRIREAVGKDFPIIVRLSRQLKVKETYSEDDMLEFIKSIDGLVDMINISCGMDVYYDANVYAVPTIFEPHNYNAEFAKKIKDNTNLLVCLVGAVMDPKEADEIINKGYADCCMFGRSVIADPFWPKKILNNQEEDIVPCIRCMHCYHIATKHYNVQCSVNPRFRRENRMCLQIPIETKKKNVVIVGGGVSGIIAALSADKQGHKVTLIEQNDYLGGLLKWASKGPFKIDLRRYWDYLLKQIEKSNVDVRLNTFANKETIAELKPDKLIIATGSLSRKLNIDGKEKMIDCLDAIDNPDSLGNKVIIIGGGSIGMELALELSLIGRKVTVIEACDEIASNGNELYKIALKHHLDDSDIEVLTNSVVKEIKDNCLIFENGGVLKQIEFDSIVESIGRVSNNSNFDDLYKLCKDTVSIGDCDRVGCIIDAVNQAYFVGKAL